MEVSREEVVHFWINGKSVTEVCNYLSEKSPAVCIISAKQILKLEKLKFVSLWDKCSRTLTRFEKRNYKWLQGKVFVPVKNNKNKHKKNLKPFAKSCRRTQRDRLRAIKNEFSTEELGLAAALSARADGHRIAGKALEKIAKHPDLNVANSNPDCNHVPSKCHQKKQLGLYAETISARLNILMCD